MKSMLYTRRDLIQSAGGLMVASSFMGTALPGWRRAPVSQDVEKDLIFRTTEPRNGEPNLAKLVQSWQTPTELFYVRSHAPNPNIDPKDFQLKVEGLVNNTITISLDAIKQLAAKTTMATLTCAGNRRSEYNGPEYKNVPKVGGVQWAGGTVGNASWTGPLLATILKQAGVKENAKHVWFEGLDQIPRQSSVIPFGASIPIEKAMTEQGGGAPMLAYKMNDATLTPDHGYPLRMVVPGYIGARSVKWLGKIVVSDRPSPNHYVATAYKIVKKTEAIDWAESGPIYRYPINAAICTPAAGAKLAAGSVELTGYALPTGRSGSKIRNVLISADGGKSWTSAKTTGNDQEFCWQLWKAQVKVSSETKELLLRATDSSGGFMPVRAPWNAKGYLRNSWYHLPVQVN